jgi:uncharacterized repeat protein (TIGR01451 family)
MLRRRWLVPLAVALGMLAVPAVANAGQSFTFLQPGFTQSIFGVSDSFMGGVAFAPNTDPWVDTCALDGGSLTRFDRSSTIIVNGTSIHPGSVSSSSAGCGLTNGFDGNLYTNTTAGVRRLDPSTGAPSGGPFGPGGNALGIAPDPQTGDLVYVGGPVGGGPLFNVDEALTTSSLFSNVTANNFIDGLAWSQDGNFLFASNRSPSFALTILDRNGNLVQNVPMTSEPDGIAFHASPPRFVVTNNNDGTMTRFDFPADDFTQVPVQSVFASGGFRGDLSQVGSDGCLYLTQDGTRYDNGTVTGEDSLVQICGGFAPPVPHHADLAMAKTASPNPAFVGDNIAYTLTVTNNGPDSSTGGTVTDTLPANVSYVSDDDGCSAAANIVTCPTGPLASGASQLIHIVVTATAAGPAPNTACVKGNDIDDNTANDCATVTTEIQPKVADLSITKTGPAFAQSGTNITYNIGVHNGGPAPATGVTVNDPLPAGETLVSATPSQGTCSGTVTCNLGSIPNGGSATIKIVVTVTAACGSTVTNTATVSGELPDSDTSNNTASTSALVFCVVAGGNFVIGDNNAAIGTAVTFWGAKWWKLNSLSGGAAPASFKGFEKSPPTVTCGTNWTTSAGNSAPPPAGPLPALMAVIVSSSISKSGPTISGNTVHIVLVQTNPGYQPNPGHAGTGTVVAQLC